jgi:hypothetical protein
MESILESFLSYGLIENIDGNDERYAKIEQATKALAEGFREEPSILVSAIVSGVNPCVELLDENIIKAKECLQMEWKAYSTAYTDEPVNLFRGMILEACAIVADEGFNASIMWLSASDVLPLLELGKEEELLSEFMTSLAYQAESNCIQDSKLAKLQKEKVIKLDEVQELSKFSSVKVDRDEFYTLMGDAAGPTHMNKEGTNVKGGNPNPHWAHNSSHAWTGAFADRMSNAIADEIELVTTKLTKNDNAMITSLDEYKQQLNKSVEQALNEQRLNTQRHLKETLSVQTQEQTRLNVLWWSEALYSKPLNASYREYTSEIATTLMPFDLLDEISVPVPASVGYMLSETVSKLKDINFERKICFYEFLTSLRSHKDDIDSSWLDNLQLPDSDKSLNIIDLIIIVLKKETCELDPLIKNSIVPEKWECSLPILSRIIFKQAQAYAIIRENA